MNKSKLICSALKAREAAYAPYSHYKVGAALLCEDGSVYTGCNIENASYSVTSCAERTALFKAVSEGKRKFLGIAVVGGREGESAPLRDYAHPCGVCRQALYEFSPNLLVLAALSESDYIEQTLSKLMPNGFGAEKLEE